VGHLAFRDRTIRVRVVNLTGGPISALELEYPEARPIAARLGPGEARVFHIRNPSDNRIAVRFRDRQGREAIWGAENERVKRMIDPDLELILR
jgi:hypothetical protein